MNLVFYLILFSCMLMSHVLMVEAFGPTYPTNKEVFKVTETIDNRHLAKKALIEDLEEKIANMDDKFVTKTKFALDNIITKTGSVDNYNLMPKDIFTVYSYYALKGELPTNGILIYWQNLFSPLKQAKEGNSPQAIQCYTGLVKVLKNSDGSAICTTLETALVLVERGFGKAEDVVLYHKIASVKNCEVGRYGSAHGLGSFYIDIQKNDMENCYMEIFWELEGGYDKKYCKISLDELEKFQGWKKGAWNPSFEGLNIDCTQIDFGNLLGSLLK